MDGSAKRTQRGVALSSMRRLSRLDSFLLLLPDASLSALPPGANDSSVGGVPPDDGACEAELLPASGVQE